MNFEIPPKKNKDESLHPQIYIESGFESFVPEEFIKDPFSYFEEKGINNSNRKQINFDAEGNLEDPGAVKILPPWSNKNGETLSTIGKKVNIQKAQMKKQGDPFWEYKVMELVQELGLPSPKPIAKVKQGNSHLIVMERIKGIVQSEEGMRPILEADLSEEDKNDLKMQAQKMMDDLAKKFEKAGLKRNWYLKDMVLDIDIPNRKIKSIIPTDWERTKIDFEKVKIAKEKIKINDKK